MLPGDRKRRCTVLKGRAWNRAITKGQITLSARQAQRWFTYRYVKSATSSSASGTANASRPIIWRIGEQAVECIARFFSTGASRSTCVHSSAHTSVSDYYPCLLAGVRHGTRSHSQTMALWGRFVDLHITSYVSYTWNAARLCLHMQAPYSLRLHTSALVTMHYTSETHPPIWYFNDHVWLFVSPSHMIRRL